MPKLLFEGRAWFYMLVTAPVRKMLALMGALSLARLSAFAQDSNNPHFSPASGVTQLDANTYQVVAEVWDSPTRDHGVRSHLHFEIPAGATLAEFNGSIASQTFCGGTQVLFFIGIDGVRYAPVIHKFMARGSTTTFVHYTIPVSTRSGQASIEIGSTGTCLINEEIQGLLRIQQ